MIVIDQDKCTQCGLCVKVCHEHCLTLTESGPIILHQFCSTCTQCVAVCPQRSLSWEQTPASAYDRSRLPSPEQLDELFKERRTIRLFKKQKIDRALLAEIASYASYAPTENFHLRLLIVDDEALLTELAQVLMQLTRRIHRLIKPRPVSMLARLLGFSHTYLRSLSKLEGTLQRGHVFPSPPVAYIFIVGDKRIPLSDASAQYALANLMYYAQAKGIGCGLCGNGQLYFDKNKTLRKRLGLHRRENILGTLLLGYPAVKFSNKVLGKALPVQWNGPLEKSRAPLS